MSFNKVQMIRIWNYITNANVSCSVLAAVFIGLITVVEIVAISLEDNRPRVALECRGRLKSLEFGLEQYTKAGVRDGHSRESKQIVSWRVSLLPYIDELQLYNSYNRELPWNSEENLRCGPFGAKHFQCPSLSSDRASTEANYFALCGSRFGFQISEWRSEGGFNMGLSTTPLIIEQSRTGLPWMKPKDIWPLLRENDGTPLLVRPHGSVRFILFADGSVRGVSDGDLPSLNIEQSLGCKDQ